MLIVIFYRLFFCGKGIISPKNNLDIIYKPSPNDLFCKTWLWGKKLLNNTEQKRYEGRFRGRGIANYVQYKKHYIYEVDTNIL